MTNALNIHGSLVALITPFREGKVDQEALVRLVEWHKKEGTSGLVACGTTGEAPALSEEEYARVLEITVQAANGAFPVVAGVGASGTSKAVEQARLASEVGVDALMVVTPYYVNPSQEGIVAHFKAVHDSVPLPILVYNIPARSVVDISLETMSIIGALDRVIGVKDATKDLARPLWTRLKLGKDFVQLSGEDISTVAFLAQGGSGLISVAANVAPRLSSELQERWRAHDVKGVQELNLRWARLIEALSLEPNPAPTKFALEVLGMCSAEVRSPMRPVKERTKQEIIRVIKELELSSDCKDSIT